MNFPPSRPAAPSANKAPKVDLPVPAVDVASVQIRYRYRDNASTRPDRSYEASEASLRVVYEFD